MRRKFWGRKRFHMYVLGGETLHLPKRTGEYSQESTACRLLYIPSVILPAYFLALRHGKTRRSRWQWLYRFGGV